jgi:hypothetical protein
MRQSGLAKRADERDHLMLQILLLTEREVSAAVRMNQQMAERIGLGVISTDEENKEIAKPTSESAGLFPSYAWACGPPIGMKIGPSRSYFKPVHLF